MKRLVVFLLLLLPLAALAKPPTLYDRVEARLKHDQALAKALGHAGPEMKSVAWMAGDWDIAAAVAGGAAEKGKSHVVPVLGGVWLEIRDTYPQGNQDISYLSFNPATKRWVSMTVDAVGNAVTNTAERWQNGTLVFVGGVTVIGEKATLRQTVIKRSERAYAVTNEERMPDGSWVLLDSYKYTKR